MMMMMRVLWLWLLKVWEGVLLLSFDYYCCYCLIMVNFGCCFDCCFDGLLGERGWRQRHYGCERVARG